MIKMRSNIQIAPHSKKIEQGQFMNCPALVKQVMRVLLEIFSIKIMGYIY